MLASARLRFLALLLLAPFLLLLVSPARAQWQMLEDVDGSGQPTYTLRAALSDKVFFQVWCRNSERQIALLTYDGESGEPEPNAEPVALRVQTDVGQTWQSEADFYRHAPGWLGTRYRNSLADARAIVEDIVAARSSVSVLLVQTASGIEHPVLLGAKGSTAAGNAFLDKCFGGAAVQPAMSLSAWALKVEPDLVNGGQKATLTGDLDQGGYFYAFCDGRKQAEVAFLSTNPSTFPYEAGDVGLTLRVEIDGDHRSASGEHFVRDDGNVGIRYYAPEYLQRLLEAVGSAQTEVAMTIESYSSGMVTRWPARNLQGLAQAAAQFGAQCFGTAPAVADTPAAPVLTPDAVSWEFRSSPGEAVPDHLLIVDTADGKGSVLIACDTAGDLILGLQLMDGVVPDTDVTADWISIKAGDHDFGLSAQTQSEGGYRYWQGDNLYQISGFLVRLATGVSDVNLKVSTARGAIYTTTLPAGPQSAEATKSFARLCLTPADYAEIDAVPSAPVTGWELLDGEAAATLGAQAVLRASAAPSGGKVEIKCFLETGAHELAFYSDDFQKQDALEAAHRLELAVFIGDDGYWPINEAAYAQTGGDLGIGTTDQAIVGEILDVLLDDAPPEMTVSTRADFNDYEAHKVPLGNSFLIEIYQETCAPQ